MKNKTTFVLACLLISLFHQSHATQFQSTVSIQNAVREHVASQLPIDVDYKLTIGQFDKRLQLPSCLEKLEVFTHNTVIKPGRNSIGVRCSSTKKWTLYMPSMINIYKKIIVLSQPVRRGDIFAQDLLTFEKRDISTLRSGFMTNPKFIIKKQATRNLGLGTVINKSYLAEPKLVKRGESISINLNNSNLSISMTGIAMMDGIKGQNIRVKNIKTKKIVQATVVKTGLVMVRF